MSCRVHCLPNFTRMTRLLASIIMVCEAALYSTRGGSQELQNVDSHSMGQKETSREEWQAQIKSARERVETIRRERKIFIAPPLTQPDLDQEASRRALEDDSLQRGDIVSTNRGMFRFEGNSNKEYKPDSFVRIR